RAPPPSPACRTAISSSASAPPRWPAASEKARPIPMSTELEVPSLPAAPQRPVPVARPLRARDRESLKEMLVADGLFTSEERSVALELIDAALAEPGGEYRILVAELAGRLVGY